MCQKWLQASVLSTALTVCTLSFHFFLWKPSDSAPDLTGAAIKVFFFFLHSCVVFLGFSRNQKNIILFLWHTLMIKEPRLHLTNTVQRRPYLWLSLVTDSGTLCVFLLFPHCFFLVSILKSTAFLVVNAQRGFDLLVVCDKYSVVGRHSLGVCLLLYANIAFSLRLPFPWLIWYINVFNASDQRLKGEDTHKAGLSPTGVLCCNGL